MSEAAYTTRDQAARPPAHLVRVMCRAAYESARTAGSTRPAFEDTLPEWQDAMEREMTAALQAAEAAGYRITKA